MRTRRWVAAQRELADGYLAGLAPRPWFTACLDRILGTPRTGVPEQRGGRYLLRRNDGTREQDYWRVAEDLATLVAGGGRTLLDPTEFDPDGRVSVTGVTLSPDGRRLAYGLNQAGSDWTTWRVRDVTTGVDLDDRVTHAKFGSPRWLPSSGGFLYWGFPAAARTSGDDPAALPTGSAAVPPAGHPGGGRPGGAPPGHPARSSPRPGHRRRPVAGADARGRDRPAEPGGGPADRRRRPAGTAAGRGGRGVRSVRAGRQRRGPALPAHRPPRGPVPAAGRGPGGAGGRRR